MSEWKCIKCGYINIYCNNRDCIQCHEPKPIAMPKALTAENGAKALLIGEFNEEITLRCPDCDDDIKANDDCDICGGSGEYVQSVPVSWTTTKEIYAMAVKHLGKEL